MSSGMKYISSDKDIHFDSTLALDAIESESLSMPSDWVTAGIYKCVISEIMLQCTQGGLDLELIFWRTSGHDDSDMNEAKVITRILLPEGTEGAHQIAGANQYYYKNPLAQSIEYIDEDHSGKIHVSLVNRDATDKKNTAAEGTIKLTTATVGEFSSVTVGGTLVTSGAVVFSVNINDTAEDLKDNIAAFTGVSGWTATVNTDTVTITASDDSLLGHVSNGVTIANVLTGDFATTIVNPSLGLGDIVLTLGCTPYFS